MKSARLFLLPGLALILLILVLPLPGQGQFLFTFETLRKFRQDAKTLSDKIIMVQDTVNSIIDDDISGRVTPEGGPEGRTPNQRIRDLKDGIGGELAKAKTNQLAFTVATQQFGAVLERYNKNRTPENLKNLQGIANQITSLRNSLDGNFDVIKNMIRQITMIRRATAEKEWDNPEGRFKDERQALDHCEFALRNQNPFSVKLQEGTWEETNLDTRKPAR